STRRHHRRRRRRHVVLHPPPAPQRARTHHRLRKGPYVSYANCGIPYALGGVIADRERLLLQTPESFKARFNVDVHVNTEVMAINRDDKVVMVRRVPGEEVKEVGYDKVVLLTGAKSWRLEVEGVDGENVFHLATVAVKGFISKQGAKRACVIGGGFIGVEAAENLRMLGLEVTVVERWREHWVVGMSMVVALAGPANRQGRLAADHICGRWHIGGMLVPRPAWSLTPLLPSPDSQSARSEDWERVRCGCRRTLRATQATIPARNPSTLDCL
ncbi:hypothetical protein B0T18DRAFT_461206, partial [Schizothecium vesticola]